MSEKVLCSSCGCGCCAGKEKGGELSTSERMEDLHDGKRLGNAREIIDHDGHQGRSFDRQNRGYSPQNCPPCDGGGSIVSDEVGFPRAEAAALR